MPNELDLEVLEQRLQEDFDRQINNEIVEVDDEVFLDEDNDEHHMDEDELEARIEDWADHARDNLAAGLPIPPPPPGLEIANAADLIVGENPLDHLVRVPGWADINVNHPFGIPRQQRHARGGRVVIDNDGRGIPQGINPPERQIRAGVNLRKEPMPPVRKAPVYVPEGVVYKGYKFTRKLTMGEQVMLSHFGYHDLIARSPDLLFVEKEVVVNAEEECIVVVAELVDYLATQECKSRNPEFDIKLHNKEYQNAYKRFLKAVTSFKQNKNG